MTDRIERKDAIAILQHNWNVFADANDAIQKTIDDLNELPSAEPEREKGEWRHLGGDEWCCTNCGYVVSTEGAWEHPKEQGKDYCEHCGADMRSDDTKIANNQPLSFEELLQMQGKPVYVVMSENDDGIWVIVESFMILSSGRRMVHLSEMLIDADSYGTKWKAYRKELK